MMRLGAILKHFLVLVVVAIEHRASRYCSKLKILYFLRQDKCGLKRENLALCGAMLCKSVCGGVGGEGSTLEVKEKNCQTGLFKRGEYKSRHKKQL